MRRVDGAVCVVTLATAIAAAAPSPAAAQSVQPLQVKSNVAQTATQAAGTFVSVSPARLLDTRSKTGGATPAAGGTVHLQVLGLGGVPTSGVAAVVLNVTAVAPAANGYVTVYADGAIRPTASNLNFVKGRTVPNLVVAPVGGDGKVALYNGAAGATPLVADVSGYYLAGTPTVAGAFASLAPARILDTRVGSGGATPNAKGTVQLQVAGKGGVPTSNVSAVILNVTAVAPTGGGYVTVYASGATRPTSSNLNFVIGQTVPNLVVAPIGSNGQVALYNGGSGRTPLVADVAGYFTSGTPTAPGTFQVLAPRRAMDTRSGLGATRPGANGYAYLAIDGGSGGPTGVPSSGVAAVVLNVTVTNTTASGYITVYGGDGAQPNASNLNFVQGQTVPNLVFAPVGRDGYVNFYNGSAGADDLLADVAGYYLRGKGSITGTVTAASDGTPLANVSVGVSPDGDGQFGTGTSTGADGTFELDELDASDYQVCFHAAAGQQSATGYVSLCENVTVSAGETSVADAALQAGGAITGTVTGTDTGGDGLGNVEVDVNSGSGGTGSAESAADGSYTIDSLAVGTYQICFHGADAEGGSLGGYLDQCLADGVDVAAGSAAGGADAVLQPGGAVTGRISLSGAAAGDDVDYYAIQAYDSVGSNYTSTSIADTGVYRIGGLPSGSYTVCFGGAYDHDTGSKYAAQCFQNQAWDGLSDDLPPGVTPVDASAGAVHSGVNVTLNPLS